MCPLEKKFFMKDKKRKKVILEEMYPLLNPDVPYRSRFKGRRRPPLTVAEKIDIVYKVLVDYEYHQDVAKEYRISRY